MLHINIICVGKLKENYLKDAIDEYKKRLSRFCELNIIELNDEKIPDNSNEKIDNDIKEKEGKNIIGHLGKDAYNIALDLGGKQFDSIEFSKKIEDISFIKNNINFIIGGSLGLSKEVLDNVNEKVSFSRLTFPHQLMRLFLIEQIYRAFKIMNNEQYHK